MKKNEKRIEFTCYDNNKNNNTKQTNLIRGTFVMKYWYESSEQKKNQKSNGSKRNGNSHQRTVNDTI